MEWANMENHKTILGKFCKLVQHNGFVLHGTVVDVDNFGIFFKTTQKTSFISWNAIKELTPEESQ